MKLHIFDNGFDNHSSHHYEYSVAVYSVWLKRYGGAVIYSCKGCDDESRYDIAPVFSRSFYQRIIPGRIPSAIYGLMEILVLNVSYFKDLLTGKVSRQLSPGDVQLFHTVNHGQLIAIYLWHLLISRKKRVNTVVLLRYSNIFMHERDVVLKSFLFYKWFFRIVDKIKPDRDFYLASDSRDLIDEYAASTERTIHLLPIPHIPVSVYSSPKKEVDGCIHFVYLGNAREEKGFELLPDAITAFLEKAGHQVAHFTIQAKTLDDASPGILQAWERLAGMGDDLVTLVDESLSTEEYYSLMRFADVLLIPYRYYCYHAQTSGIFTEALSLGKPIVVTRGTWMEKQANKYGAGVLPFQDNDAESMAESMAAFLLDRDRYSEKSNEAISRWRDFHSPENYVETLSMFILQTGECR